MFADESPLAGFRAETEHLTADRLPVALALCLGLLGLSGLIEHGRWPEHVGGSVAMYAGAVAIAIALLAARRPLLRTGRLTAAAVGVWSGLAILVQARTALTGGPAEVAVLTGICLITAGCLMFPWGLAAQITVVASSLAACAATLIVGTGPAPTVPTAYYLFAVSAIGAISLFGAHHLDLHRFAIFVEATRREEEAAVGQSLVAIAKEINDALDAEDVLDRIATVIRSALHASWTAIVLCEPAREVCTVVGAAGAAPDGIAALRGVEFGTAALPLIERVLHERDVVLSVATADTASAALMDRWRTRALLGAALMRRGTVAGVLLAGSDRPSARFSARGHDLCQGIAQHVAIALNNVRLVADLRQANALKSDFLSTMSHELRTPLNVIIGYADLLHDEAFGVLAAEQHDVLQRLRTNAHSLLEMINATLEVNRIEAGRSGAHLRNVDVRSFAAELQADSEHLPRHPGVALRWEVPRASELIRTDPLKLKIIVRNLIGNALKFTTHGHVAVQIAVDPRSRTMEALVRDTGPGIDPEHVSKIFDMFHQAPSGANAGGVGLGLYIVKRFAELLGGHVSVTSVPGQGSAFRLSLPTGIAARPISIEARRRKRSA